MKAKLIKDNDGYWLDISDDNITKRPLSDFGQLSIKNCEAIENGYDLDELIKDESSFMSDDTPLINKIEVEISFMRGFKKALEIRADKKYSEEDVLKELNKLNTMPNSILDTFTDDGEMVTMKWFEQSLQRTEWDVEIEMETKQQLVNGYRNQAENVIGFIAEYENILVPKLDEDGCLILKRL
jgi:hypothetical protein